MGTRLLPIGVFGGGEVVAGHQNYKSSFDFSSKLNSGVRLSIHGQIAL
jgi:hypothetical protein